MQSSMTFAWSNQPLWHHYDTIWKWCYPVLYSHWLVIVDDAKQVHTCKRYIYWSNMIDSPSDCPFVTSSLLLYPRYCAAHHNWSAPLPCYIAWGPGHSLDPLCPCPSQVDLLSSCTLLVISRDLLLGLVSHSSHHLLVPNFTVWVIKSLSQFDHLRHFPSLASGMVLLVPPLCML